MKDQPTEKIMLPGNSTEEKYRLSIVIPNRNGAETIGHCLEALFASSHDSFEVVVVDDCSEDNSVHIIKKFPCKLIELISHAGAAAARNRGARNSQGEIIFFTDADCLVLPDTLQLVEKDARRNGPKVITGGTYTCKPFDNSFFSLFQSVFINYSELKKVEDPDYIATHAMAIHAATFRATDGFQEKFLPILEDVEFSHRLRREGYRLRMADRLLVRHIFNYSLGKSFRNGYDKAKFWVKYSILNRDLFSDSGTASLELKSNVLLFPLLLLLLFAWLSFPGIIPPAVLLLLLSINLLISHRLLYLFFKTGGLLFAVQAGLYYLLAYPLAVGTGALAGFLGQRNFQIKTMLRA
jgi:glycosyltransferase involved in cell wall biosynthesis